MASQTADITARLISDLMRDFNLTRDQAAGFAGNLGHETRGFQDLTEVGGSGRGYGQWTGARRKTFENFLERTGLAPNSYEGNYGYLKHELTNTTERAVLKRLRNAPDVQTATRVVSDRFLRPGVPRMESRQNYAKQAVLTALDTVSRVNPATADLATLRSDAAKDAPQPMQRSRPRDGGALEAALMRKVAPKVDESTYAQGGPTQPNKEQIGFAPTGRPELRNPDGSVSTELSITVTDPRLNGGKPTNIPSIWGGRRLNDEMAVNSALASGQNFTAFPSIKAAERAAEFRSQNEILTQAAPASIIERGSTMQAAKKPGSFDYVSTSASPAPAGLQAALNAKVMAPALTTAKPFSFVSTSASPASDALKAAVQNKAVMQAAKNTYADGGPTRTPTSPMLSQKQPNVATWDDFYKGIIPAKTAAPVAKATEPIGKGYNEVSQAQRNLFSGSAPAVEPKAATNVDDLYKGILPVAALGTTTPKVASIEGGYNPQNPFVAAAISAQAKANNPVIAQADPVATPQPTVSMPRPRPSTPVMKPAVEDTQGLFGIPMSPNIAAQQPPVMRAPVSVKVNGGTVQPLVPAPVMRAAKSTPSVVPVGTVLGVAANGGVVTQGKNGPLNSSTQNSSWWKSATGG